MNKSINKSMYLITALLAAATAVLIVLLYVLPSGIVFSLAITAGTALYHFSMRLAVAGVVSLCLPANINAHAWWFRPRKWEPWLFNKMQVKRWKRHFPSFDAKQYDLSSQSINTIVNNTCKSEIVHAIILIFNYLPLAFPLITGDWSDLWIFASTSLVASLVDVASIILQRFNRPRLLHILDKQTNKH